MTRRIIIITIALTTALVSLGIYYGFSRFLDGELLPPPDDFQAEIYAGVPGSDNPEDPDFRGESGRPALIVSWYAVEGAESYNLYISRSPTGPWEKRENYTGSAFNFNPDRPSDFRTYYISRDYGEFPDSTVLYLYMTAVDKHGREGKPSPIIRVSK
jgi:hypothetical protein